MDKPYALFATTLILLGCLPVLAGFVGPAWELSQLAGLVACVACVALSGAPIRARNATPPVLISLPLHALLGWTALGAVGLHVAGLVLADRTVLEYLKPSMPLYMAAGAVAAVLLLLLVLSASAPARRRLWASHRAFQATHVIAGAVLSAALVVHVVATARYAGNHGRWVVPVAATVCAMFLLLRRRRAGSVPTGAADRGSRWVFGRYSTWVVGALGLTSLSLVGLLMSASGTALREPLVNRTQTLPLDFPHTKHVQVNCLTCHHNFADGKGFENCVMCHKSARNDLKAGAQARFHAFCFECHRHPNEIFTGRGPVAGCASCHHASGEGGGQ